MRSWLTKGLLVGLLVLAIFWFGQLATVQASPLQQIPTGSIATVTGTPQGAVAVVLNNEQGFANVRAGPNSRAYEIIGNLVIGQQVPVLGRSPGGDWLLISYPGAPGGVGWVYIDLVNLTGSPPIVEPPPTPTPRTTPTIDPTFAAQFLFEITPTRLPTYTAPAPVIYPTQAGSGVTAVTQRVPMALLIIGMGSLGLFGLLITFLRGR